MKNPLPSLLGFFVLKKQSLRLEQGSRLPEGICRQFSLAEIKYATNNFHPDLIIGEGVFGIVYKGTIDDGTIVAVQRRQAKSSQGAREFKNEVQFLCQLRHPHLISLVGFCEERNEMIIVFEYMSKGPLSDYCYGKVYAPLPWKQRLRICIGAACGLHYLHTGAKRAVIHRDIKSSSILCDDEVTCKFSDFSLSKLGPRSMSKALIRIDTSRVMGTSRYLAPECNYSGELTEKSDVFSFGVVLFEVLCGRRVYDQSFPKHQLSILEWASELVKEGTLYPLIDPYLKGRIAPECLQKYLEIACRCLHHNGNERPAMGEVEATLELAMELQEKADSEIEAINPSDEFESKQENCWHLNADFVELDRMT